MRSLAFLPLLTILLVFAVGCDEVPLNERYGQLLSPDDVEGCPEGCVPYVTAPNDSLYLLADRAYGQGYKLYRIASVEENKDTLEAITTPTGTLEKGHILFLPPDEKGNKVEPRKPWHFGGTR
jgi:hypothetical protein